MLYIEEKTFHRQIDLLATMVKLGAYDLVVWTYPEATLKNIFDFQLSCDHEDDLEPVTTYEENVTVMRSSRLPCNDLVMGRIISGKELISKNIDSLCLYKKNELAWDACTIGHEGMCLVKNEALCDKLIQEGFTVSKKPPEWW